MAVLSRAVREDLDRVVTEDRTTEERAVLAEITVADRDPVAAEEITMLYLHRN